MNGNEVLTIILSIGIPMLAGFGWILNRIAKLDERVHHLGERVARIEGMPYPPELSEWWEIVAVGAAKKILYESRVKEKK